MTFWSFMAFLNIFGPAPAKFMCESWSLPGPRGIIVANAFCSAVLPVVACLSGLRRAFSPQNVKNIVTSSSIAAAPWR